jgi:hypothetical protein
VQGVKECILQCEKVEGHRQIPQEHYDEDEELAAEHIVCCACGNEEADDDNDILLCDGHGCSRAYHVQCLPFKDDFILQVRLSPVIILVVSACYSFHISHMPPIELCVQPC